MFKYGASFNCTVGGTFVGEIGGAGDGYTDISFVSNDLEKLKAKVEAKEGPPQNRLYEKLNHEYAVEELETDVGGRILHVYVGSDRPEDEYIIAVIFEDPHDMPEVIE